MKKIKGSKRGLTFTISPETMGIGESFIYSVKKGKIIISKKTDGTGTNTVSRKKCGSKIKPLIDLRGKDVKKFLKNAEELTIIPQKDGILITVSKTFLSVIHTSQTAYVNYETLNKYDVLDAVAGNSEHLYTQCANIIQSNSNCTEKEFERPLRKTIKMLSLFSGCGMMDYAFSKDKHFEILFATDYSKAACESYKRNIGPHILCEDIRNLNMDILPDVDFMAVSPPCCAHSNANRHSRLEDAECYDFVLDVIRAIKAKKPKLFALENVENYLTANNNAFFNLLEEKLADYKLTVNYVIDYLVGGFQKRKRLILFGSRNKEDVSIKMEPIGLKKVKEAFDKITPEWPNYNDITVPRPESIEKMKLVPAGGNFKSIPSMAGNKKTHSNRYRRIDADANFCPTIANFRKCQMLHPTENRIISVAEALALSGFEKDFMICGNLSEKQLQVANGVPFHIARVMKDAVLQFFKKFYN